MTRLALATAAALPDLDDEGRAVLAEMNARGWAAEAAVWDHEHDWSSFDLVIVRSTWDYTERPQAFLDWADHVGRVSRLLNSPEVLRWNTDKRYLGELAAAGVPVVPTQFLAPGDAVEHRFLDVEHVVKPVVSAGSKNTLRIPADRPDRSTAHAAALLDSGRHVMVQPYLDQVDVQGETAMLFFDGRFSHAMRKGPLLRRDDDLVDGLFAEEVMTPREASTAERDVARLALEAIPDELSRDLLYARVDVLPTPDGPQLLELELAEPSLFLEHDPSLVSAFVDVVATRLGR